MRDRTVAKYRIVKVGVYVEAIVDVTSTTKGWLGCCVVTSPSVSTIQDACYSEALRRAQNAGVELEQITQESQSFNVTGI